MNSIDFTNASKKNKAYSGANGSKLCITYNNEQYMLKFPSKAPKNDNLSYSNSCFSEYIGCKIYKSVGIDVQEVLLGTYKVHNGVSKVVVACKDFATNGKVVQDFASMKNLIIDSNSNGYGTELASITETIEKQTVLDVLELSDRFWDMFIIDALIGNFDRHNGNWGFLYSEKTDFIELAPVFDCGSSLFSQADDDMIDNFMKSPNEIRNRIYLIPTSAIQENGKRINYFSFISSLKNEACNRALKRITPLISLTEIYKIIDNTPFITENRKNFYKTILKERKEKILDYSLDLLCNRQKSASMIKQEQFTDTAHDISDDFDDEYDDEYDEDFEM